MSMSTNTRVLVKSLRILAVISTIALLGCAQPVDGEYLVSNLNVSFSGSDPGAVASLNQQLADSDDALVLSLQQSDGGVHLSLLKGRWDNGQLIYEEEIASAEGDADRDGFFEAHLQVTSLKIAGLTLNCTEGIWISGFVTDSGIEDGRIIFDDPHEGFFEKLIESIVEAWVTAITEAIFEAATGMDVSLNVVGANFELAFEGQPVAP